MANFTHFLSIYVTWSTLPCLAIIGVIFFAKQRTTESFVFASGLVLLTLGAVIQLFFPFGRMTLDEAGNVMSSSGPPLIWYAGSIVVSVGLVVTVIGFAVVTWKVKRHV